MLISIMAGIAEASRQTDEPLFSLYWFGCQFNNAWRYYFGKNLLYVLFLQECKNAGIKNPTAVLSRYASSTQIPYP